MDARELIARRVARELRDNTLVNLGIGLPTLVAAFVPAGMRVYFQSENGIVGFGARPPEGMEDVHLTDAGGAFVSALPGAVAFDSATSFALIRGGHLDGSRYADSWHGWRDGLGRRRPARHRGDEPHAEGPTEDR